MSMNVRTHLTEMVQGKHQLHRAPEPTLWKQLTVQQQEHLAKHWARLLRQIQLHPNRDKEVQDVEN